MITIINSKKDELLEHFLLYPIKESHLRELSRLTKISLPWVSKTVTELSKQGLLTYVNQRGLVLVKADRESNQFRALKRAYNLFSLHNSGLVGMIVEEYMRPEAIILFGSYGKGEDIESSDVDIAVITKKKIEISLLEFEKKLKRKIKILEIDSGKIEKEFWNTLANGIVLYGYLEVKK